MNYLAHIVLAGDNLQHQIGSLMGDFTKGRIDTLSQKYPADVMTGIVGHRAVDQYTDQHPDFHASRLRISPERRRVSGIIIDVAYDHFLSLHWDRFCTVEKSVYIENFYQALTEAPYELPARLQRIMPSMIEDDWLGSYERLEIIGYAYDRISTRFRRENNLAGSLTEVEREFEGLESDFLRFFPDIQKFYLGL